MTIREQIRERRQREAAERARLRRAQHGVECLGEATEAYGEINIERGEPWRLMMQAIEQR